MTLLFEYEADDHFSFEKETVAKNVVRQALLSEGFPEDCEVSLTLTDEDGIAGLNEQFRGIAGPTDVLSFPMIDFGDTPADIDALTEADRNPDTGEIVLGDIVLSVPRIVRQAEEYGHSELREYAFLIAHSMLHLLGYDHMEDEERIVMEEKQARILTELEITR